MILYNPTVSGSLLVTGSLTTTGTITSQTLVVQTITSSIEFNTGSTRNGTLSTNTHEFTGSVSITGSAAALLNVNNGVLYVSSSGNVGINNVSPTVALDVTGAGKFSGGVTATGTGLNPSIKLTNTTATTGVDWHLYSLNNGNFGIYNNTAAVSYALQITSAGAATFSSVNAKVNTGGWHLLVQDNTSMAAGVGGGITFNGYKTGTSAQGVYAAIDGFKENATSANELGGFRIWTSNGTNLVERMRITSTGNVGIGTSSPSAPLHIVGNQFIAKSGGGGTYKQTIVGQTTAAASGVAKTVAYVGHTNALTVYVWATQSGSSGTTAVATIVTIYGAGTGNVVGGTSMGGVTGINVAYNNSGYVLTISVTYSGAAPTINYVIDGINDGNDIYTI